ncbi:MAG TPA: protease modulator HflC, partial [Beijerinckiaceae bacterium]|nr:protease modulator HflC [Beijerinckiaceae bacterium]
IVNATVRAVLADATAIDIVRNQRARLVQRISDEVNREANRFGIQVVDVRLRRVDLPEANSQAIFQRMQTERQREAAEFRALGAQQAQEIRARAERESTIIVAEAERTSQQVRGQGDAERNRVFAEVFNRDPDFFSFYRSMQAYEAGLRPGETRLVLSPTTDFFRYFADLNGRRNGQGGATQPGQQAPVAPAAPGGPAAPGTAPQAPGGQTLGAAPPPAAPAALRAPEPTGSIAPAAPAPAPALQPAAAPAPRAQAPAQPGPTTLAGDPPASAPAPAPAAPLPAAPAPIQ